MNKTEYQENLISLYRDYGFELEEQYPEDDVIVFSMTGGYFNNVDIVCCSENADYSKAKREHEEANYSTTIRGFKSFEAVEKNLFTGFFQVKKNKNRFNSEYNKFTKSVVGIYGENANYTYLETPYFIDEEIGERNIVSEISDRLDNDKPILFLIEAAAGFGKTCTAYEIAKLINEKNDKVPFLAELSRNRQARIFKHILLDEIDRVFPTLPSKLVEREIKTGRVITVLDGFDELLRDSDSEADFEGKEPMLETIGQFLRGKAKLILTTRKTVLFEGGSFFDWVDENSENFELIRLRLDEPRINDWLDKQRYQRIRNTAGDELDNISNPVLLSYLRCVNDEQFEHLCKNPSNLVESYFEFMLIREKERQELELDVEEQHKVLDTIAIDMAELNYTSEERDYFIDLIQENCRDLIEKSIKRYPIETKPSKEEIANKLASHALLDRSSRHPNFIGFINNFVLGNYIARNIIQKATWEFDRWLFIEPAISSYKYRDKAQRLALSKALESIMPYLSVSHQLTIGIELQGEITIDIIDSQIETITFEKITFNDKLIKNSTFVDCIFKECIFNLASISDVTFLTCQFYSSEVLEENFTTRNHFIGCKFDNNLEELAQKITTSNEHQTIDKNNALDNSSAEKAVLERFWPVGRDTITYKHRPIRGICNNYGGHTPSELFEAIDSLKKKDILLEPKSHSFVEINFNKMIEIKNILGRS